MDMIRQTLKKKFGTPEKHPHLRIICATIGPGKARLLDSIAETHSISEAARRMKMSYKRAWQLIDAMNNCFRKPLVESSSGGRQGGRSKVSPLGEEIRALYHALYARCLKSGAQELRRLHGLLKEPAPARSPTRRS